MYYYHIKHLEPANLEHANTAEPSFGKCMS